jgi:hypothetical protein
MRVPVAYTGTAPIRRATKRDEVDLDALSAWLVANGATRTDDLDEYLAALLAGCIRLQYDYWLLLGQWALETDYGRSEPWTTGLNPAGLGMTQSGGYPKNPNAQRWSVATDAAFGHLAHMLAYTAGEDWDMHWPEEWPDPSRVDNRFGMAVMLHGGVAKTIKDLNERWAIDPDGNYHGKIAARANELKAVAGKEGRVTITFGKVPMPVHERRLVLNSQAWNDLGVRVIRGCVWHRMYGSLWGTDGYFRGEAINRALTDIGVGVEAIDGATNDGRCFMWNDPRGRRSPWANGPVTNPRDDGKFFVDRYGISAVNRDLFSIEISGEGKTALSEKARRAVVAWTAYWADQYKVSHETFPQLPAEGNRSFVIWHGELNGDKWGTCPGLVVETFTNAMLEEVRMLLKGYQDTGDVPVYAEPQPVPGGTRVINDRLFVAVEKDYTIKRATAQRLYASPDSPETGPIIPPESVVRVSHMVEDVGEGSGMTLVLANGSRIPAIALVEAL